MPTLNARLVALRRRLRLVVGVRCACLAGATLLAGLLLAGLIDTLLFRYLGIETWPLARAALLTMTLALTGVVGYLLLILPLVAKTDDLSLALRVEEQYPILNDSLASTVQFLESKCEPPPGISPSLQREAVQRALRLAQSCDFNKVINARGLSWSIVAMVLVTVTVVTLTVSRPAAAWTAFVRLADPYGDHAWIGKTELTVRYPTFLAIGQPLSITGDVWGTVPAKAEIEFDDGAVSNRQLDIKETSEGGGRFIASGIKLPTYRNDIGFRVRAGNAVSPRQAGEWHRVALRSPPQLTALAGKPSPKIVLRQPRYTGLPEWVTLLEGSGNLDVVAGSQVTLRAATDRPIQHAWVEFKPLLPGAREALLLAGLGPRHPLDSMAATALASSVWGRMPGVIETGGAQFSMNFTPALTGAYLLTIQDKDRLSKSYEFDLNVKADPVPVVSLLRPSTSQSVLSNAELTLQILAEDEIYGLRTVYLEYRRKDKRGQWLDIEPQRLVFSEGREARDEGLLRDELQFIFTLLPSSLVPTTMVPLPSSFVPRPSLLVPSSLAPAPKRLLITERWSIRGLALEGETLVIQACAADYNDVVAFPQVGRSHEIELKVVGKTALAAVLDEQEVQIQQQLLALRAMQDRALNKVIGAEQQWRAMGKLRPEDVVELSEAEQLQKDIQARIGAQAEPGESTPATGLRGELAQLEEMLKENKLPKSEVADRVRAIREELERIAREHLPKIEPGLNKARRELESPEQAKAPDAKEAGDLGEARKQQEEVYQALDGLLRLIEEQSTFQQLKGELRAILQEQQEREKETAALQEQVELHGQGVLKEKSQLKGELRRTAELQRRLAERTERLIEQLKQDSEKAADANPLVADMLSKAAKIGGPLQDGGEAIAEAMRDIANDLRDDFDFPPKSVKGRKGPYPQSAHSTQVKVIEAIEKMLNALDQTRADEVERLVVRQKKEERNLNDLAARMNQLQEKIELAKKIADPAQREAVLKKLADELRGLQKTAEDTARDLSHAQARQAADDVTDAAKKMERALRRLERGEEPDEALQQAQEKIDSAKDRLKEAREVAEEELAREQIARILDRLKGFKERQDGIVRDTNRLREEFVKNLKWLPGKVGSMADLQDVQKGLAGELGLLRDKLKGAKVFNVLLDRSHKDMTTAAARLFDWRIRANAHLLQKSLGEKDLADETQAYEATAKLQKSAGERLQHLIDALAPEVEAERQEEKAGQGKNGGPGGPAEKNGGIVAQDGIPSVAQLKALKAEQLDVNARTKEFAERHPSANNLTPSQREELDVIHAEQERLLQLFRELIVSGKAGEK
jgi:hypothetical protein